MNLPSKLAVTSLGTALVLSIAGLAGCHELNFSTQRPPTQRIK